MKSRRSPPVSEADVQIFRETVGAVRPLRRGDMNPLPRPRPRPARFRVRLHEPLPLDELLGPGSAAGHERLDGPLQFLQP